jgi:hypothetical protein
LSETIAELSGTRERRLHGHLLVQQHPDEQRERFGGQESIGIRVTGDVH